LILIHVTISSGQRSDTSGKINYVGCQTALPSGASHIVKEDAKGTAHCSKVTTILGTSYAALKIFFLVHVQGMYFVM
ncbi:MAG TPA: hypothetical protein VHK27_14880, partial [Gammaproteobacteria bacterium]|nr:hypothetical protein [Gammaproteobacteria bacterium]